MNEIMLCVGEYYASNKSGDIVRSLALGTCVSVVMLEPRTRTVGMVHVALPDSTINKQRATEKPGYFADTAIPALLNEMGKFGCNQQGKGIIVKLAGGAQVLDQNNTFAIGKRNVLSVKKALWNYRMGPVAEDIGDNLSRSVDVFVDTGKVVIYSPGKGKWNL